jgi:hypothetical protein
MVPHVWGSGQWVLYAMDIPGKKMHVLDPNSSWKGEKVVEEENRAAAKRLVEGLAECANIFYESWEVNPSDWEYVYYGNLDAPMMK